MAIYAEPAMLCVETSTTSRDGTVMPRYRETSPEVETEITQLYASGATTGELAAKYDLLKTQIARIVRRNGGIVRGRGPNRLTAEQETEMVKDYVEGMPVADIAAKYNFHRASVVDVAVRHGAEKRPDKPPNRKFTEYELLQMRQMWSDGKSQTAIAQSFHTSQSVISRVLRQSGIVPVVRQKEQGGEQNAQWKGGRITTEAGYVLVWVDPDDEFAVMRNRMGYVLEHRLAMARQLGRPIEPHETVHHISGEKTDNRPENLQLRQGRHGNGVVHRCRVCGSTDIESTRLADHDDD